MKIAIFTDTYEPQINGVVVYLRDSIKQLAQNNDIILFAPGGRQLRVENVGKNLRIFWIPASEFPLYEGYRIASMNYARIFGIVKKEAPDIVHAHIPVLLGLQGLACAEQLGIPSIVTYHTHLPEYVPSLFNGKMPSVFGKISSFTVKKMINEVFGRADIVTAPTNELTKELTSYGLKNVINLPNGIEFNKFNNGNATDFRKKFSLGKKKIVLYAGRVSVEKRIDVLLHAFKLIEKPDLILLIVGGGPYTKDAKELAESLGLHNVVFTGFVSQDELASAYACANIFASASDTETFGLTFVEAMHMGLPVVAVKMLGPAEIVKEGKTGLLVGQGKIKEFAKAMEKLLGDEKLSKTMGDAARKESEKYTIENNIRELEQIYTKLVIEAPKKKTGPIQRLVRKISKM